MPPRYPQHDIGPSRDLALARALGRRFKVFVPCRSRKVYIVCRRCLADWRLPRSEAYQTPDDHELASWRRHRCDRYRLREINRERDAA